MYQERVIAFIDILGFGNLVEQSATDVNLQKRISEALDAVSPNTIIEKDWLRVNESTIPPEELEDARAMGALFTQAVRSQHQVDVSYFSDSIAISALANDPLASQMVLDLVCKLCIRIWTEHKLVLRGGVAKGLVYHEEGGKLFGPAMNRAYHLESKMAIHPRILIDQNCLKHFLTQPTFRPLVSLVAIESESLAYISLPSCYHYTLTSSTWTIGADDYYYTCLTEMTELPEQLEKIMNSFEEGCVRDKYKWLLDDAQTYVQKTPHRLKRR